MGLRFRKSIKIAPGVKLNLGSKSAGVSVGGKYGGVSVNSKTGARARVSAPGTGVSYSEKIGGKTSRAAGKATVAPDDPTRKAVADMTPDELRAEIKKNRTNQKILKITAIIALIMILIVWLATKSAFGLFMVMVLIYFWIKSSKEYTAKIEELQKQLNSAN